MYIRIATLLISLLLFQSIASARDFINNISVQENSINVSMREESTLSWTLSSACTLSAYIVDIQGNIVRTLLDNKKLNPGEQSLTWDGLDSEGAALPNGIYFPILRGKSQEKGLQVFNPSANSWGEEIPADSISWQKDKQQVTFRITKMALGRLRVFIEDGGPMYYPLTGWRIFMPGNHSIPWNGKDLNGVLQVTDLPSYHIGFDSFSLPKGAIFLNGSEIAVEGQDKKRHKFPIHPPHGRKVAYLKAYPHALSPDPLITVNQMGGENSKVSGTVQVHVAMQEGLSPAHRLSELFEIYLYVNGHMDTEINPAEIPQTTSLDTTKYPDGEYLLTINILSMENRAATHTQRVTIDNQH